MAYVACVILCFFEILFIFTVVQVDDDDDDDDDLKKIPDTPPHCTYQSRVRSVRIFAN